MFEQMSGVRPGDYPIGSPESRAAARLQLAHRQNSRERLTIIHSVPRPRQDDSRVCFGSWSELPDGKLWRLVYVSHEWKALPLRSIPSCPDCGAPFVEAQRLEGQVCLRANCVELHDPELAESGVPWAVQMVFDRIGGKPVQPIAEEGSQEVKVRVSMVGESGLIRLRHEDRNGKTEK